MIPGPTQNQRRHRVQNRKLLMKEKEERARLQREPRRFLPHLAGIAAAVDVALDMNFYMISDEEEEGEFV